MRGSPDTGPSYLLPQTAYLYRSGGSGGSRRRHAWTRHLGAAATALGLLCGCGMASRVAANSGTTWKAEARQAAALRRARSLSAYVIGRLDFEGLGGTPWISS